MKHKLVFSIIFYLTGFATLNAQDDHTCCILIAKEKDYFTYVEPSFYFRSTPREELVRTATINVTYNGFSVEAQSAFQYAVDILETEITSSVNIELIANWVPLGSGILGSAGANYIVRDFPSAPLTNIWYGAALANKLAGYDLYPSNHDINANFNSNFSNWYFGTDGNTPPGKYDFVSVVLHEIIHGLGFFGSMTVTGNTGSWGNSTPPIYPYIYDTYAVNGSNQRLLNTSLFPNPSVDLGTQLRSNNIFFDGANAIIGNGGTNPKLYTPATWSQGSSYSHWDETTYPAGNINSLMTYAIGSAEAIHHIGYITRGLLKDIGWTIDQPLPVELSSFTAKVLKSGGIQLNWRTETEVSNYGFEIERLQDYKIEKLQDLPDGEAGWEKIGFVEGNGNSNSQKDYSFTDNSVGYGNYAYRLKQIDTDGQFEYSKVIEIDAGNIPGGFVLEQNYPNPFNPSTTIKFALGETQTAELKVFDVLGNEVATLFNGIAEGGKVYELELNGESLSTGIYFYRLASQNKVESRKMLLIK
jgi:Secretion system C-terminal sorting domain